MVARVMLKLYDLRPAYYKHRIGAREMANCERCGVIEGKDHWLECESVDAWRRIWGLLGREEMANGRTVGEFISSGYPDWVGSG